MAGELILQMSLDVTFSRKMQTELGLAPWSLRTALASLISTLTNSSCLRTHLSVSVDWAIAIHCIPNTLLSVRYIVRVQYESCIYQMNARGLQCQKD